METLETEGYQLTTTVDLKCSWSISKSLLDNYSGCIAVEK